MCEPMTILAVGSAAMGAFGAFQGAQSQQAQLDFQAQQARNNATLAEYNRLDALERGGEAANKASREAQRLRGAQVVRLAANGMDINSGTPAAILADTDYFGQQDAQEIRNNAARQAWGYEVERENLLSTSKMLRRSANRINPWVSAGTSLLGSAAQFGTAGGFGGVSGASGATSAMNTTGGLNFSNFA